MRQPLLLLVAVSLALASLLVLPAAVAADEGMCTAPPAEGESCGGGGSSGGDSGSDDGGSGADDEEVSAADAASKYGMPLVPTPPYSPLDKSLHVPCLLDDPVCLGDESRAVPKPIAPPPRKDGKMDFSRIEPWSARSKALPGLTTRGKVGRDTILQYHPKGQKSPKEFSLRASHTSGVMNREAQADAFTEAIEWLHRHQYPQYCMRKNDIEVAVFEHPQSDGDGYTTRMARLMGKVWPELLAGKVIVLKGGLRGYHDAPGCSKQGFECVYQPFSTCSERKKKRKSVPAHEQWRSAQGKPPAHLLKHGRGFWMGVLYAFLQRPNADLLNYMKTHVPAMMPLPGTYVGVHVRKGDKNESNKYGWKDYLPHVEDMARSARALGLVPASDRVPVYLATDDKDTAKEAAKVASDLITIHFLPGAKTRGIGKPGKSVTSALLHKEVTEEENYEIALEVAADLYLLSNAAYLTGIMSSRVTSIAGHVSAASGRLVRFPVALEAEAQWVTMAPHLSHYDTSQQWEVCTVPFMHQHTDI